MWVEEKRWRAAFLEKIIQHMDCSTPGYTYFNYLFKLETCQYFSFVFSLNTIFFKLYKEKGFEATTITEANFGFALYLLAPGNMKRMHILTLKN